MAAFGRVPNHVLGGLVPMGGIVSPSGALLEQKTVMQHAEIQRLLSENQRLAMTHVALRQELAATQQDLQRLQQAFNVQQTEKDQQVRALLEKINKLEADLHAMEPLKTELENAKAGAHKLLGLRQDLTNQITQLTQEVQKVRMDAQQAPGMIAEMDTLRQEMQLARTAFEHEKNANTELLEHRGAMETNLVAMAREVEKLRAELTNTEMRARGPYGGTYAGYPSVSLYGDTYGLPQIPVAAYDKQTSGAYMRL